MWLKQWYKSWLARSGRGSRLQPPRRCRLRPILEQLEDRTVPSNFTAASVSDLIADISAANLAGGSNTITLAAKTTFALTAVNNTTDGANGLPVIVAGDNLTIVGNGDTIARTGQGTPAFRLLDVASGGALTLQNLTLQGGLTYSAGGAIYNQGTLTLNGVTVQQNVAHGYVDYAVEENGGYSSFGTSARGGGIYSSGALTLQGGTKVQNNQAVGGQGQSYFDPFVPEWVVGRSGDGLGGGLYVAGGTLAVTNSSLYSNTALGGQGPDGGTINSVDEFGQIHTGWVPPGDGGNGLGGGLYVQAGTVTLTNATVSANTAQGGKGGSGSNPNGSPGLGEGGGIYIEPSASVCLDAFTLAHLKNNKASTSDPDIYGSYSIL